MSKTVLLVDDSVTQSFALKLALVRAGFRVLTAPDGRTALKTLAAEKPDVVVADVIMPMMDGYELCRQIKDNRRHAKTPVILMSGLGETHDQYWRKHAGADLYVAKTADASKLVKPSKTCWPAPRPTPTASRSMPLGSRLVVPTFTVGYADDKLGTTCICRRTVQVATTPYIAVGFDLAEQRLGVSQGLGAFPVARQHARDFRADGNAVAERSGLDDRAPFADRFGQRDVMIGERRDLREVRDAQDLHPPAEFRDARARPPARRRRRCRRRSRRARRSDADRRRRMRV